MRNHLQGAFSTLWTCILFSLLTLACCAQEPADEKIAKTQVELPGLVIDLKNKWVDLEARVCMRDGYLELIACRRGSKEHESIVAITARPMHIHTALLLLGARNGNPAMRQITEGDATRWVNVPPKGDPLQVSLVTVSPEGDTVERSISEYVMHAGNRAGTNVAVDAEPDLPKFPDVFLFAGSHLRDTEQGPREYLADTSGNVISIVTFGDELLCLPKIRSHDNGALFWKVDATHLPKVGTKVTLRLRRKPAGDNVKQPQAIHPATNKTSETDQPK